MSSSEIENLISSVLPKDVTLTEVKSTKLTSSGDNYGSTLLAIDATVRNENLEEGRVYLVAKKVPQNELIQEMFNSARTFPNEVGFYQQIVPCLKQFQKEQGTTNVISSFPDFCAASSGKIDQNSTLVIKNIKRDGFDIVDRNVGFDLPQSRFILDKMAELHATVHALKVQKPKVFEERVFPFFQKFDIFVMDDENNSKMIKGVIDVIKDDEVCGKYLPQLEDILMKSATIFPAKNVSQALNNPFSTLVHSDMWSNNIMVRISDNQITDVKFVDYQLYEYTSLTRDVVFFIFSSIPVNVLKQHFDALLIYYHDSFIRYLKNSRCDVKMFSFDIFLGDMKKMVRKYEFFHILIMLPAIYATSKDTKDVEQLEMDSFIFHESEVTQVHKEKACFVVHECLRRGWLL